MKTTKQVLFFFIAAALIAIVGAAIGGLAYEIVTHPSNVTWP